MNEAQPASEALCEPGGNYGLCKTHPTCEMVRDLLKNTKEALSFSIEMFYKFVAGEPYEDGTWPHLVICSGSRRVQAGTPGHGCICDLPRKKALNERDKFKAELERMCKECVKCEGKGKGMFMVSSKSSEGDTTWTTVRECPVCTSARKLLAREN